MDPWVSESFYSHFPSLNVDKNKEREEMNRLRRQEYQDYIKKTANDYIPTKDILSTSRSDKTDEMDIIVNNPNYETSKSIDTRPGSTRHKLLQDLKHTGLAKMMFEDAIQSRNEEDLENENKKKKEYHKELMRQIEEKRKEIQVSKLLEKAAEESMTKKLNEQRRNEKIRYEFEENKQIHNRLLEQLKNDLDDSVQSISSASTLNKHNDTPNELSNQNKVYKFFQNSGTTYRKNNHQLSDGYSNDDQQKQKIKHLPIKQCSHVDRTVCPYCNMRFLFCKNCNNEFFKNQNENCRMFCKNCESQYFICLVCDNDKDICNYCKQKKNICMNCIINYCVQCGNSMNERKTLNEILERNVKIDQNKNAYQSFQILDDINDTDNEDIENDGNYYLNQKNHVSTNIDKRSLFHPDFDVDDSKYEPNIPENFNDIDDVDNFDMLRLKTNETLLKYIRNYGDLSRKKITKDKNEKPYLRLSDTNTQNSNLHPQKNYVKIRNKKFPEDLSNQTEIPNMEKISLNANHFVITQLGDVRRQLKFDKLKNDHIVK